MGNTSGVALPYDLDGEVSASSPVWKVHRGHRRGGDKARVTVFVHTKSPENKLAGLARNCMSRLKITKHPNILAYVVRVSRAETSVRARLLPHLITRCCRRVAATGRVRHGQAGAAGHRARGPVSDLA